MSIRGYKWSVGILASIVLLLAWLCFSFYRERVWAAFISFECETTDQYAASANDPEDLARNVHFLQIYYQDHSRALEHSKLHRVVERDYQHSLTSGVVAFRRITTNDLGGDIDVWLKKYYAGN
jgi:hypothetical protein